MVSVDIARGTPTIWGQIIRKSFKMAGVQKHLVCLAICGKFVALGINGAISHCSIFPLALVYLNSKSRVLRCLEP